MKRFEIEKLFYDAGVPWLEEQMRAPVGVYINDYGVRRAVEASTYSLGSTEDEIKENIANICKDNQGKKFFFYLLYRRLDFDSIKKAYNGKSYPPDGINLYKLFKDNDKLVHMRGVFVDPNQI